MKITNKHNLPDPIVNAIREGFYKPSQSAFCSVTGLLQSPKYFWIHRKHYDDISQDAMSMIWSLEGSAMHEVLGKGASANSLSEERLHKKFETKYGSVEISGAMDYFDGGNLLLSDYKKVGVFKVLLGDMWDYEFQLNVYAYLLRRVLDFAPTGLENVFIFRDWDGNKYAIHCNGGEFYPPRVYRKHYNIWSDEEVETEVRRRIERLLEYEDKEIDQIPPCSPEERWERGECWKIYKVGNKRATKVCHSQEEADNECLGYQMRAKKGDQYEIKHFPPIPIKCVGKKYGDIEDVFCPGREYCSFYLDWVKNNQVIIEEEE